MRIRIGLLTIGCAMVLCLPLVVSSEDNSAQAKAREAMRAQPEPPAQAQSPAQEKPAVPQSAEPKTGTAVTAVTADTESQAKAREAVRGQPASTTPAQAPATATAQPTTPAPAPAPVPAQSQEGLVGGPRPDTEAQARARAALTADPVVVVAAEESAQRNVSGSALAGVPREDTEAQAKARAALQEQPTPVVVVAKTQPAAQSESAKPKPVAKKQKPTESNSLFEGLEMPEPAFSPEQEAALAKLFDPYATDQISTEEYHKQRAAILAGT